MKQIGEYLVFEGGRQPTLILAHGAGAPMNSPFMLFMANHISQAGFNVVLFEFEYMKRARREGRRLPPDRPEILVSAWQKVLTAFGNNSLVIGGKSMGGRIASMLLAQNPGIAKALVCLGYPFHPPGKSENLRVAHLESIENPVLVCQGERDPLGNREEIEAMTFPETFEFFWLPDGDHSFKPRVKSGLTEKQNLEKAVEKITAFLGALNT